MKWVIMIILGVFCVFVEIVALTIKEPYATISWLILAGSFIALFFYATYLDDKEKEEIEIEKI